MRVCSTSTAVTSGHGIILMLSANVGIKSASASAFGLVSSGTLSWAPICYLTGWLLNDIVIFWELFYWAACRCASSCFAEVVVSARRSSSALWGRCPAVIERDITRKVDLTWRVDCMASSVAGSNSDGFFPVGTPKGASLRSPSQDYRRSRGKNSSSCDNGQSQHVVKACSREWRAAHCCLPWNGRRPLQTPIVTTRRPWFDHLIACAIWRWRVSWKLNVTGHMLYDIFDLFFNKESHYGDLVREFRFTPYIWQLKCRKTTKESIKSAGLAVKFNIL
jgi:hypothetical protein